MPQLKRTNTPTDLVKVLRQTDMIYLSAASVQWHASRSAVVQEEPQAIALVTAVTYDNTSCLRPATVAASQQATKRTCMHHQHMAPEPQPRKGGLFASSTSLDYVMPRTPVPSPKAAAI